jgi:diguanylate cyclase
MASPFRSLRAALLVPFVLLVVAVAVAVSWSSYVAGLQAVDNVSRRLLEDVANRIAHSTEQEMATSAVVLNAVAPDGATRREEASDFSSLAPTVIGEFEKRLWVASGLFPERNGYVYYGSETGRFVGIQRNAPGGAEIRIRAQPNELRRVYRVVSPNERGELLREENYDPHSRPWYQQAMARKALSWSPIYRNFAQRNLTITLAKPVLRADGTIRGVAATDIALTSLEKLVQSLRVSENSVAFVVERDGSLVASSADRELALSGSGDARLAASKSASALVRDAFAAATALATQSTEKKSATLSERVSTSVEHVAFESEEGRAHASVITYRDSAGLDWRFVVAVPRADQMAPVYRGLAGSAAIGGAAVLLALALGTWLFHRVANDVSVVTRAAERLAAGHGPITSIPARRDEIGALASSVVAMSDALLYDPLTGALNRAAFVRQFANLAASLGVNDRLAIIYIDLDRFKKVNDRYGHTVGDAVLAKSAERIRRRLRDNDLFARYGGDEFVIMVNGNAAVDALPALVDRLAERLSKAMNVGEHHVAVGASIGAATYPDDGDSLDQLISIADARMYDAKRRTAEVRRQRKSTSHASAQ